MVVIKKKYGDLDEPEGKKKVAFALMEELGAQWHVGHHSFAVLLPKKDADSWKEGGTDEQSEDDYPHESQYDEQVIGRLLTLIKSFPKNLCEDPTKDDSFKGEMNKLSSKIKEYLEKFNGKNGAKPSESSPFFVSMRAYEYSGIADNLPNKDLPSFKAKFGRR